MRATNESDNMRVTRCGVAQVTRKCSVTDERKEIKMKRRYEKIHNILLTSLPPHPKLEHFAISLSQMINKQIQLRAKQ
jgi:hypothetical protein